MNFHDYNKNIFNGLLASTKAHSFLSLTQSPLLSLLLFQFCLKFLRNPFGSDTKESDNNKLLLTK